MKPTTAAMLIDDAEHQQRLRRAQPDYWRQIAAAVALMVGVCSLLGEMYRIQTAVDSAAQAHQSPVTYEGKFIPDKPVFHPGEDATFHLVRNANFEGPELFLHGLASFENADTGVGYSAGGLIKRLTEKDRGRHEAVTVRTIPANAKPGKHYTFEGQTEAEGTYRTLPVGFCSEPFEIRNWGSEREKAQYDQDASQRRGNASALSLDAGNRLARE